MVGKYLSIEGIRTGKTPDSVFSHVLVFRVQRGKTVFERKGLKRQINTFISNSVADGNGDEDCVCLVLMMPRAL